MRCSFASLSTPLLISSLLVLSSAFPPGLQAQSTTVPLPPTARVAPPRVNRPGFAAIPKFNDAAQSLGLTVSHISSGEKRYIVESMSGGVGLFDCDGDGRLDIVTVNGSTVDRYLKGGDPMVTLYHQETDGTFKDITKEAGLTRRGWGMGVAVADYDNDGKLDLFVTGYGGNVLYHNLGGCKFEDVTEKAGVRGGGFSTGAAWGDYDRDGNVDLFVSRYVHVDLAHMPEPGSNKFCLYKGLQVQCGPWGLEGESDLLYHNRGDGTFEEVSVKAGVHDQIGYYGLGAMWSDYDNDGWPDLVVANDSVPNYLYHNNRNGTFSEVGMLSGMSLSGDGTQLGNMGVDFGDYDHSGRFSLFITTFQEQPKALWRNLGANGFEDVSWTSGVGRPSYPDVCWGTSFFDMANSGWLDLLDRLRPCLPTNRCACGRARGTGSRFFWSATIAMGRSTKCRRKPGLRICRYNRAVARPSATSSTPATSTLCWSTSASHPVCCSTRITTGNHRVLFKLVGTKSNRAAIGARVTIHAAGVRQIAEVRGGGSYLSQNDLRFHFGLGKAAKIDSVEIRWPAGKIETLDNLAADSIYTIVECSGIRDTKRLQPPGTASLPTANH